MALSLSSSELRFRDDVRRFFAEEYPQEVIAKLAAGVRLSKEDHIASQQALNSRGWLGLGWPTNYGGTGWTPVERYIFDQELDLAGAAPIIPMAVIYIGPIICAFGSEEQKRTWLPDILESRTFWAQGYSEPEAGSDLASLHFSAVREGDDYVLNGTKIWTSGAQWADWIFCLARTSKEAKKQQGITLICAPLDSPGITIHPIRLIDGSHELNRIEFDDVRVPVANRIGEEGQAWHYANILLKNERLSYAHIGAKKRDIAKVRELAKTVPAGGGRTMAEEPSFVHAVAAVEARLAVIETAVLRALRSDISMATAAALKIACTECAQTVTELFVRLAGRWGAPMLDRTYGGWANAAPQVPSFGPQHVQSYLLERAQTIYGGSTEIQKNIIWRALPEMRPDPEGLDEQQAILARTLGAWFAERYPFHGRSEAGKDAWTFLSREMGLFDPAGIGTVAEAVAMQAAGRALLREPLGEALIAAGLLRAVGGKQAQALLERLRQGDCTVLAWSESGMRDDFMDIATAAERDSDGWVLRGAKALVTGGEACQTFIVAARTGIGLSLFAVPKEAPGVAVHSYPTIDGRGATDLLFDAVRLPSSVLLDEEGRALPLLEAARDHAIALQTAEAAGLLEALLHQTIAYTVQRRQFGQPIAEFQALQHMMVDMYLECEMVKAAMWLALGSLNESPIERARTCSAAQVTVSSACRLAGQKAIQLHGGMGMTDELPVSHYARRALVIESAWGDAEWHLKRMRAE
ncbi:acyl-CoA dehydrogenase family protein [Sphingobium sp. EM0848]|uniref:acyl-CoA dehydrogenase family protein n=1 Tax=Sphingobium sp. EM0848 TaxID=2743473 RepID=UPI00159CB873|nr:acyl-CoA dehydrogenase family protein [Sphingobium sp. EM0848]